MKIKNLKNNRIDTVTYKEWKDNYLDKGIYKDYEITNYSSLVELQKLLTNGNVTKTFMSKSDAVKIANTSPNQFVIKNLTFDGYDKWLVKESSQSLFKRFLSNFLAIFTPNAIPKKKAEPISRNELIGIIGVIIAFIMLILFIIVEWDNIYSFFKPTHNLKIKII